MTVSELNTFTPVGWREWVSLPDLNLDFIKAKVDTGARTSSLHVENLEEFEKDGIIYLRFDILPWQKNSTDAVKAEAPLLEYRNVKSSSGHQEKRPVIKTHIRMCGTPVYTELTLTNRDVMGFRMLIGRQALKHGFAVLSGKSYLGGKPSLEIRDLNRSRE